MNLNSVVFEMGPPQLKLSCKMRVLSIYTHRHIHSWVSKHMGCEHVPWNIFLEMKALDHTHHWKWNQDHVHCSALYTNLNILPQGPSTQREFRHAVVEGVCQCKNACRRRRRARHLLDPSAIWLHLGTQIRNAAGGDAGGVADG